MGFLKKLFGSGGGRSRDKNALYVYVRPQYCEQIVEVRINLLNDLSMTDDGKGYFTRKLATAVRCPYPAEIYLYFDKNRRLTDSEVEKGELVSEEEYRQWQAQKEG